MVYYLVMATYFNLGPLLSTLDNIKNGTNDGVLDDILLCADISTIDGVILESGDGLSLGLSLGSLLGITEGNEGRITNNISDVC